MKQLRQGDVLLVRIDKVPSKKATSKILARGEHSNHSHIITGDAEVFENDEKQLYVSVGDNGALLQHLLETDYKEGVEKWTGEHAPISLEKGYYKVIGQTQYDPYKKITERVLD